MHDHAAEVAAPRARVKVLIHVRGSAGAAKQRVARAPALRLPLALSHFERLRKNGKERTRRGGVVWCEEVGDGADVLFFAVLTHIEKFEGALKKPARHCCTRREAE